MKKLLIEGIIGWDVTSSKIRQQLEEFNNDDVEIEMNSPGGFVYDGIAIANLIRDYAKNKNNVTIKITSMAASMGSYIALSGNKVIAYDNATYMIHNVQSIVAGDYRAMTKEAKEVEALTNLLAQAYVKKTGKSLKEIRKLMDNESYFYGDEMMKAGFVDEIISTENKEDKAQVVLLATGRVKDCISKMKASNKIDSDIRQAASLIDITELTKPIVDEIKPNIDAQNKELKGKKMDIKEFKNTYPEIFDEAVGLGIKQEKDRVNAHIIIGKQANALDKAVEFIEAGKSTSDLTVQAEYMALAMKSQMKNARVEDNVKPLNTEIEKTDKKKNEEDTEKAIAEYNQKFGKGGKK
jgi:ATP-dependent protease ClpP protease subunit